MIDTEVTADNLTDEQLQGERLDAWRIYRMACLASGFAPMTGSAVPIDEQVQRKARIELAEAINARRM